MSTLHMPVYECNVNIDGLVQETPVCLQWSYVFLVLTHRYGNVIENAVMYYYIRPRTL